MDFSFLLCSTQNDKGRFDACDLGRCGVDTDEKYKRPDAGDCGVGITFMVNRAGGLEVNALVDGSSADDSGMVEVGDVLHEVNGQLVLGTPVARIAQMIKGKAGSLVDLGFRRGEDQVVRVRLQRQTPSTIRMQQPAGFRSTSQSQTGSDYMAYQQNQAFDPNLQRGMNVVDNHLDQLAAVPRQAPPSASLSGSQQAGVGLAVIQNPRGGRGLIISGLIKGMPAERSNIYCEGDEVVAVDGQDATSMTVGQLKQLIVGPPGSSVSLCVRRNGSTIQAALTRALPNDETQAQLRASGQTGGLASQPQQTQAPAMSPASSGRGSSGAFEGSVRRVAQTTSVTREGSYTTIEEQDDHAKHGSRMPPLPQAAARRDPSVDPPARDPRAASIHTSPLPAATAPELVASG